MSETGKRKSADAKHHAPFAQVYVGLIEDPKHAKALGLLGLRMFIRILAAHDSDTGEVTMSVRRLAEMLHIDRREAQKVFNARILGRYLDDTGRKSGHWTVYRVRQPFRGEHEVAWIPRHMSDAGSGGDSTPEVAGKTRQLRTGKVAGICRTSGGDSPAGSGGDSPQHSERPIQTSSACAPASACTSDGPRDEEEEEEAAPPLSILREVIEELEAGDSRDGAQASSAPVEECVLGEQYPVPDSVAVAFWRWANPGSALDPLSALFDRRAKLGPILWRAWSSYPDPEVWRRAFASAAVGIGNGRIRSGEAALEKVLASAAAELGARRRTDAARAPRANPCKRAPACSAHATRVDPNGVRWCDAHAREKVEAGAWTEEQLQRIDAAEPRSTVQATRESRDEPIVQQRAREQPPAGSGAATEAATQRATA